MAGVARGGAETIDRQIFQFFVFLFFLCADFMVVFPGAGDSVKSCRNKRVVWLRSLLSSFSKGEKGGGCRR